MSGKLYLVTRRDLRPGAQAAQLVHGMATFAREYPETFELWERGSNTVVCLAAENIGELSKLLDDANHLSETVDGGLAVSWFQEPDLDGELTCLALEPTAVFEELCKELPLACR